MLAAACSLPLLTKFLPVFLNHLSEFRSDLPPRQCRFTFRPGCPKLKLTLRVIDETVLCFSEWHLIYSLWLPRPFLFFTFQEIFMTSLLDLQELFRTEVTECHPLVTIICDAQRVLTFMKIIFLYYNLECHDCFLSLTSDVRRGFNWEWSKLKPTFQFAKIFQDELSERSSRVILIILQAD